MNIYLLSNETVTGYDTYESAVVIAESEEEARSIYPNPFLDITEWDDNATSSWCSKEDVKVELIGTASPSETISRVVCSSFNAG